MSSMPPDRASLLQTVFRLPTFQTMVARKSSITNAFVTSIIPVIAPTPEEIEEAITILGLDPADLRCAYCGDHASEWDHLRPLVQNRRPTGYITEIANLVPSCGKCNQSKGNKDWRGWILSGAKRSPTGRGVPQTSERIERLEAYVSWRTATRVDFERLIGKERWDAYWALCEAVVSDLQQSQSVANKIRSEVVAHLGTDPSAD